MKGESMKDEKSEINRLTIKEALSYTKGLMNMVYEFAHPESDDRLSWAETYNKLCQIEERLETALKGE